MHPKTFQILLRRPFGFLTQEPYVFYLQVQTYKDAFDWVARVFEGIDLHQAPASPGRVGNPNTVQIIDCDRFRKHDRVNGRLVTVETPEGHFRQPADKIAADVQKIYRNLKRERESLASAFHSLKMSYEREDREWVYERMELVLKMHVLAERWEASVLKEYLAIAPRDELVMPEKRMPAVLKHIVTSVRERAGSAA